MTNIIEVSNKSAFLFSTTVIPQLRKIALPLEKYLGIPTFGYMRAYNNGSYLILSTGSQEFLKNYFEQINDPGKDFMKDVKQFPVNSTIIYKWPAMPISYDAIQFLLYDYNTWHGLTLCYKSIEYVELFNFAFTKQTDDKTNFFLQNVKILQEFITYFKTIGNDLLDCSDKSKLGSFKKHDTLKTMWGNDLLDCQILKRKQFLDYLEKQHKSISLSDLSSLKKLSPQELRCIELLARGYTMKDIGRKIDISHRTVESYLRNVKDKYGLNYKSQIIDMFHNHT